MSRSKGASHQHKQKQHLKKITKRKRLRANGKMPMVKDDNKDLFGNLAKISSIAKRKANEALRTKKGKARRRGWQEI